MVCSTWIGISFTCAQRNGEISSCGRDEELVPIVGEDGSKEVKSVATVMRH